MLKKVGIVAAAATAGMLALSPLAFAADNGGYRGGDDRGSSTEVRYTDDSGDEYQSTYCIYREDAPEFPLLAAITGPINPLLTSADDDDNRALNCSNFGDDSGWGYAPQFDAGEE